MEDDERIDSCNHLAPLKVKNIFLDLFLLRWQNSFWWDWRISSCSWIQYVEFRIAGFFCFGLFFSFWIILSRLLDEITHKEVETCLGFSASFHLCLPKSLLSLLPLDVHMHIGEHAHSHTYIYTHTGEHRPSTTHLWLPRAASIQIRKQNEKCRDFSHYCCMKFYLLNCFCDQRISHEFLQDGCQSLISLSTISLERRAAFWRMGRSRY